jgi:hypothetical protein
MPSFRTIHAGPYHCAALTEDSRLFFWGKGNHGVLGQGDEHNQYEPVQIKTDTNKPVQFFATGEFHSVLLQPCVRQDLWDYTLRYVPNTDLFVFIPERKKLNQEDLASRFNADEGAPVERYNPEGRTSKGLFSNVIDVTQNGKIVLDNGLKVVEVDPDQIEPSRALSVRGKKFLIFTIVLRLSELCECAWQSLELLKCISLLCFPKNIFHVDFRFELTLK